MTDIQLKNCAYLGGCGYPIAAGDSATLSFREMELVVQLSDGASFAATYLEVATVDISGPGTLTTGGGFIGGGFGVEGALEGMAIAAVLNALTTKSKIHTFLSITTNIGELHFHYGAMEPRALRIGLAPVYTTLRRLNPGWLHERVSAMKVAQSQGALSDADVERLKERLNVSTVEVGLPPPADPKKLPAPPIVGPKGRCPNCAVTLSLHAEECPSCKAMFGQGSAWKIAPLQ